MDHFNPRSREGSDEINGLLKDLFKISIHAPAKGATDADATPVADAKTISIHAPAKGATLISSANVSAIIDFNPRSREGSDQTQSHLPHMHG